MNLASGNHKAAEYHQHRALTLNPNNDLIVVQQGELHTWLGAPEEGLEWIRKAMRLNPHHPERFWNHLGRAFFVARRYSEDAPDEPDRLHSQLFSGTRTGGIGLLRDLQDLYLMAAECDICWTVVGQGARGARDRDLQDVVQRSEGETAVQLQWLRTRMKAAAPQALVVAD